jgi:hypothetical protein
VKPEGMKTRITEEDLDIVLGCGVPLFNHPDVFSQMIPHSTILPVFKEILK